MSVKRDVAAVAALVLGAGGIAVGAAFAASAVEPARTTATTGPPIPTVTQIVTETVTASASPAPTRTITVTAKPTSSTPQQRFGNGSFSVGAQVLAGRYHTAGPVDRSRAGCVWKRTRPGGGILAQGTAFGPITIVLRDGDRIDSANCQPWAAEPR